MLRYAYDASRPTLVLHGPRRCGKSSFLLHLPRLLPSDLLPVYYSLQAPAATSSAADFCYGLVRALRRDLAGQGVLLPEAQRAAFHANAYAALEDWLDQALPLLGTRSLLLCFDEFEKLGEAVAQGRVSMAVFDQLRELIQHSSMAFLFCGVQTLAELGPNWSSYFISVRPMEMTYLEPEAAAELLTNPDPEFALRYAPGIVEQVLQLTRCQPYLLQLLGEEMVRQANQQQTRLLTPPLLEAALEGALTAGATPYFTNLWSEYTGTTPEEVAAGQRLLQAIAHAAPLPATEGAAEGRALRRLLRYHVIEGHDGGYRCQVPLVARWVRERAELTYV
ncbi:MAG: ATP-binding protein [Candidatus Viridilinea halotolerans]|uniref:ATP-binding protein n=1 Tax=Candidatus Viridilinea halotolerans TaxID=2491704 RepID=A0A426TX85_9CHLR|nr:MAG: ATP-binding protein [Candidatus Viridilinea halotolerans]